MSLEAVSIHPKSDYYYIYDIDSDIKRDNANNLYPLVSVGINSDKTICAISEPNDEELL